MRHARENVWIEAIGSFGRFFLPLPPSPPNIFTHDIFLLVRVFPPCPLSLFRLHRIILLARPTDESLGALRFRSRVSSPKRKPTQPDTPRPCTNLHTLDIMDLSI